VVLNFFFRKLIMTFEMTLPIDTPLDENGETDETMYREMIDWYVSEGIDRFLLDGTTGGWTGAGLQDRTRRHKIGVEQVRKNNGFAAVNIASGSVADSIHFANSICTAQKPDRLVAMLPGVPTSRSEGDVVEFFSALSRLLPNDVPWGLYEFESLLGVGITVPALKQILQLNNAPSTVKWTSGNHLAALQVMRAIDGVSTANDFNVIPSHELAIELAVREGSPEFVSGALVPVPELANAIATAAQEGDEVELGYLQRLLTRWHADFNFIASKNGRDFFNTIKAAMAARHDGYPLFMVPGTLPVDKAAIDECRELIQKILKDLNQEE
jgi:dihydrodipicolinate synthase/N-acetylneuraminate lyase